MTDPRDFWTDTIPAHFNARLDEQEKLGGAGRALYDGMREVEATIRIDVDGNGGGSLFLNIEAGHMTPGNAPAHAPFLTLRPERGDFASVAVQAGNVVPAQPGGLPGLAGKLLLTRSRVEGLASVEGTIRFEVKGEHGFALVTHFGGEPVAEPPNACITVDDDVYRALRTGQIDPTRAFMEGKIHVDGDVALAMQLALAALT
jgi:hypothetical protein